MSPAAPPPSPRPRPRSSMRRKPPRLPCSRPRRAPIPWPKRNRAEQRRHLSPNLPAASLRCAHTRPRLTRLPPYPYWALPPDQSRHGARNRSPPRRPRVALPACSSAPGARPRGHFCDCAMIYSCTRRIRIARAGRVWGPGLVYLRDGAHAQTARPASHRVPTTTAGTRSKEPGAGAGAGDARLRVCP